MSEISSQTVLGIGEALRKHAPELLPVLAEVVAENEAVPEGRAMGESAHGTLEGGVPLLDGERILEALRKIEAERGWKTEFAARQINFLVLEWERFIKPRKA